MNLAAETATLLATKFFKHAVLEITFDDARKIVTSGETSAADFFKGKTQVKLSVEFKPVIQKAMEQYEVTRQFGAVVVNIHKLPYVKADVPDVEEYVLWKSLGGLFLMIAEQEKKIRKDQAAQVTALLNEVFGKRQGYLI